MFAIIKTGGKQYRVSANDIIRVEKLAANSGEIIEFTDVLMMGKNGTTKVGTPLVSKARVVGTVVDQIRDDKVIIFKKKRRHNYRRKNGHRQYLTVVQITDILGEGESPKPKAAAPKVEATKPEVKAEIKKAEPKKAAPKAEIKAEKPVNKAAPKATKTTKTPSKK